LVEISACGLPRDHSSDAFLLQTTLDFIRDGNIKTAAEGFEQVNAYALQPNDKFVYDFVDCLLKMHLAPVAEREGIFEEAQWSLTFSLLANRAYLGNRLLRITIRRCLEGIARQRGGIRAALWARIAARMPRLASHLLMLFGRKQQG
jgi:hypothetical protein